MASTLIHLVVHFRASSLGSNPAHAIAWWYSLLMGIVFPLGIPLWYFYLLFQHRFELDPGQLALRNEKSARAWNEAEKVFEYMPRSELLPRGRKFFGRIEVFKGLKPVTEEEVRKYVAVQNMKEEEKSSKGETTTPLKWKYISSLDEKGAKLCAIALRRYAIDQSPELKQLRFLYDSYEPSTYWFEVFETFRRLMLTGGLVFLKPGTASQIVLSMMICLFSMRVYAEYTPFVDPAHDPLAETAQWQLFLTLLGALCLKV